MNKRRKFFFVWTFFVSLLFIISACSDTNETDVAMTEKETKEVSSANVETEVIGFIQHEIKNADSDKSGLKKVYYTGGEMRIDYALHIENVQYGCGFVIFVDGVPQPYRIEEEDEYKYMYVFYPEEIESVLSFFFVPIIGQAGDELEICIGSVFNPDFKPDMVTSNEYGMSYDIVENVYLMKYTATPEFENSKAILLEEEGIELELESVDLPKNYNDKRTYLNCYINGEDMKTIRRYDIENMSQLDLSIDLFGHSGVIYKTTVYIDQKPISETYVSELKKETAIRLHIPVDISNISDVSAIYAVSVPANVMQYKEDVIGLLQTPTIALVRNEMLPGETEGAESVNELESDNDLKVPRIIVDDIARENGCILALSDNDMFYLASDKIYVYYAVTGEKKLESEKLFSEIAECDLFQPRNIFKTDEGVLVCGRQEKEGESEYVLLKYDIRLDYMEKIVLSDVIGSELSFRMLDSMEVSRDGKKVFYQGMDGLYIYDLEEEQNYKILDGDVTVIDFIYNDDNNDIFLICPSEKGGEENEPLRKCGILDLETGTVSYLADESVEYAYVVKGEDKVIIGSRDQFLERKHIWIYETGCEESREYNLSVPEELQQIVFSENARYVAALYITEEGSWQGWFEDTLTGEYIGTVNVSDDNFAPYQILCYEESGIMLMSRYNRESEMYEVIRLTYK